LPADGRHAANPPRENGGASPVHSASPETAGCKSMPVRLNAPKMEHRLHLPPFFVVLFYLQVYSEIVIILLDIFLFPVAAVFFLGIMGSKVRCSSG
jgi:hypothetical protein